jgi:N-carbamoyl-L-amino-acid hydrolase
MAGLEVARSLKEHGLVLDHPLEVVDFLSEEPSDYGVSCVGSRAIAGALTSAMLAECDPQGETLLQGISRIGGQPENLDLVKRGPNSVAAFVELHIEQGPVLEKSNLPIGVVSNIVGISRHRIVIEGRSDHAGTTPMELRRDALVGAAAIVSATDERARSFLRGTDYVVATVGHLNVTPNASNAVPGRVDLMMEVRSDNAAILSAFADSILRDLRPRIEVLGLRMRSSQVSHTVPTRCNAAVMQTIEEAAASLGYPSMRMPSGAGHDAVYMAHCGPAAMILIPCLNGRSHCPEESITSEQLAAGAQVLHRTVLLLDESLKK